MTNHVTFEYYSTFAPVSDPFATDTPRYRKVETDTDIIPLQLIDNSYIMYSHIAYNPLITTKSTYFT